MKRKLFCLMVVGMCMLFLSPGPALAEDVLKVGVIGPTKITYGRQAWQGAQFAEETINQAGGIQLKDKKYKVKVIKADSNCYASTPDAMAAMERLVTVDKVDVVVGGVRSESTIPMMDIAGDNKRLFLILPSADLEISSRIAEDYDRLKYCFRPSFTTTGTARTLMAGFTAMTRQVKAQLGVERPKVALVAIQLKFGDTLINFWKKILPALGVDVVGVWRPAQSASDVTAELTAIKAAGAHIILAALVGPVEPVLVKQWGEMQIPAALYGLILNGTTDEFYEGTNGFANYMATFGNCAAVPLTERTLPYYTAFQKRYNEAPSTGATNMYSAIMFWKDMAERAGSVDSDVLVPVLEKADNEIGTVINYTFTKPGSPNPHDAVWGPKASGLIQQWRDGKMKVVWPDGHELHPVLIKAMGCPTGFEGVRYEGTVDYVVPPWAVKYWKNKK